MNLFILLYLHKNEKFNSKLHKHTYFKLKIYRKMLINKLIKSMIIGLSNNKQN